MNRISPMFFILVLLVILVIDAYMGDVPALSSQAPDAADISLASRLARFEGTVTYHQVVPLRSDASLTVLLKEICQVDGQKVVLGGHTIKPTSRPTTIAFAIPYDPASISPDGLYVLEARIISQGRAAYELAARPIVVPQANTAIELTLTRVTPWTPLEIALTSGRLSRFSIGQPQLPYPRSIASTP